MSLTTNGLRLNRELVADWAGKGLKYLRVTLDGPPEIHDCRRPYRSGQGSFATILENLCSIKNLDGFGIGISINIDEQNVGHVAELLDILDVAGLKDDVEIILEPTFPHCRQAEQQRRCASIVNLAPKNVGKMIRQALDQVVAKQFRTPPVP